MEEKIKTFLDEGYDFIDESFSDEPLEFVEANEEIIVESEGGTPHQYKILGRASGVFQSVGGFSRNNRRYLPEHWSVQLNKPLVKERLAQRDYMGTIGHHDHPVLDSEIAQGLVSHLLSKLEIREDKNGKPYLYGEIEILDTPAGRILKAMYEGGASIFVSSRAAGKLRPVPGQTYQEVDPINYHFEGFDVVRRAGFPVAKPVYEEVKNEPVMAKSVSESVKEEAVEQPVVEPVQSSNEELSQLKSQLDQLTKIIEKVVDDVYEDETKSSQPKETEDKIAEMLFDPSISEEVFEELENALSDSNPELLQRVMENSRNKFNDEHSEKSGLKIDYYRFGGNKPYKIVPKDKSYFEASWDSPRYRTLKQAQKHVLDSYNKPKEEPAKNESLAQVASLLASSTISESSLVDILELLIKKEAK